MPTLLGLLLDVTCCFFHIMWEILLPAKQKQSNAHSWILFGFWITFSLNILFLLCISVYAVVDSWYILDISKLMKTDSSTYIIFSHLWTPCWKIAVDYKAERLSKASDCIQNKSGCSQQLLFILLIKERVVTKIMYVSKQSLQGEGKTTDSVT